MASKKGLDLQQTKGRFQVSGIVYGTETERFYKEGEMKNGKNYRKVNFEVKYNKNAMDRNGSGIYINLMGMEQEKVYFSTTPATKAKLKLEKNITYSVPWSERYNTPKEGYDIIGATLLGLSKKNNSDGKEVIQKIKLMPYDACEEIANRLVDGLHVLIKGNIVYSSNNGKRYINFEPDQILLCDKEIDFESDSFKPNHEFKQTIAFMGMEKDSKEDSRYVVAAKIIKYNSIEDAEFIIKNDAVARTFKRALSPYDSLEIHGKIVVEKDLKMAGGGQQDNGWGEESEMDVMREPTKCEFLILGAKQSSLDKTIYSEEVFDEAMEKINNKIDANIDFGNTQAGDTWGSGGGIDDEADPF